MVASAEPSFAIFLLLVLLYWAMKVSPILASLVVPLIMKRNSVILISVTIPLSQSRKMV
jgi:hypothetical protein